MRARVTDMKNGQLWQKNLSSWQNLRIKDSTIGALATWFYRMRTRVTCMVTLVLKRQNKSGLLRWKNLSSLPNFQINLERQLLESKDILDIIVFCFVAVLEPSFSQTSLASSTTMKWTTSVHRTWQMNSDFLHLLSISSNRARDRSPQLCPR